MDANGIMRVLVVLMRLLMHEEVAAQDTRYDTKCLQGCLKKCGVFRGLCMPFCLRIRHCKRVRLDVPLNSTVGTQNSMGDLTKVEGWVNASSKNCTN